MALVWSLADQPSYECILHWKSFQMSGRTFKSEQNTRPYVCYKTKIQKQQVQNSSKRRNVGCSAKTHSQEHRNMTLDARQKALFRNIMMFSLNVRTLVKVLALKRRSFNVLKTTSLIRNPFLYRVFFRPICCCIYTIWNMNDDI